MQRTDDSPKGLCVMLLSWFMIANDTLSSSYFKNSDGMKKNVKVADVMTKDVLTIDINDTLQSANKLFFKHPIRHLPVLSEKKLIGILSQTDILRISFGNTFSDDQENGDEAIFEMLSINQVMKHSPITTHPESSIKEAGHLFTKREFHALPVVKDDKLVGIITTTDIINYFLNHC